MKNLHLHIIGRVQGVGFRYSARKMANVLGLSGFVKNMPDSSVYIEVEGNDSEVNQYLQWCRRGPEHAIVEQVTVHEGAIKNYIGFETQY